MNTNAIKSFAKEARLLLLDGVSQRLKYWGFKENGTNTETLQTTQGGYIFRGQPFTDVNVPAKWNKLKTKLNNKQSVKDVVEEASYTWFNRLMAIKILEANGYIPQQLAYTEGSRTPLIVQNAKRGEHSITNNADKELLIEYLKEDKDEEAFALLTTHLCNTNPLLHDIFGRIDDYTEILFPQNCLKIDGLLDLINSEAISNADFKEVELIGWLYQFYISDKKDEVFKGFKKNIKARAEDIPAATQIFTPKWIVKYMVENTVGKIYLDYEPDSDLRDQMKYLVENESDSAVRSSAVENKALITDLTQLTLIDPAAGSGHILVTGFELFMKMYREAGYNAQQAVQNILQHNLFGLDIDDRAMQLARFAVLLKAAQYDAAILEDPIVPHIYSFPEDTLGNWFTQTYYSKSQSNWHDLLGMQLAEPVSIAWEETKKGKTKTHKVTCKKGDILNEAIVDLLELHCNDPIAVDDAQELELFWGDFEKPHNYSEFFYAINLLRQGKNLGSAIKLNISKEVYTHIKETYHSWLLKESVAELTIEETSIFNLLKPFLEVFLVLANQYKAVVANPPYMGQSNMNSQLKDYVNLNYKISKSDLYTVMIEKISMMTAKDGRLGLITPPSWMFTISYAKLRDHLLKSMSIDSILNFGRGVFGADFGSVSFVFQKSQYKAGKSSTYRSLFRGKSYVDSVEQKENWFFDKTFNMYSISQDKFKKVPNKGIAYWIPERAFECFDKYDKLSLDSNAKQGLATGDNNKFRRFWQEVNFENVSINGYKSEKKWFPYNSGGEFRKWYGNQYYLVDWSDNGNDIKNNYSSDGKQKSRPQNTDYYFKESISWSKVTIGGLAFRYFPEGFIFDVAGCSIFNEDSNKLFYLQGVLNSKLKEPFVYAITQSVNYEVGIINNFPIELPSEDSDYKNVINLVKDCIKIAKNDWDKSEVSWDFEVSPLYNSSNLKEAFLEFETNVRTNLMQLYENEVSINKILLKTYGLEQEFSSTVDLKEITAYQDIVSINRDSDEENIKVLSKQQINKEEVLSQFISYAIGVFLGRYRLDKPRLNIAHPNPTEQELAPYTVIAKSVIARTQDEAISSSKTENSQAISRTITIDDDGIVPLMGDECAFPDDALTRTKDLLLTIWGEDALTENINFLQDGLGMALHKWLTEKFWSYHTSMYKKKPIYWLFSSNVKKPQNAAFKVLVYMHRMDKYTVQQIQRNYLYPHQEYIKNEISKLEQDEDSLNKEQQKRLELLRDWELECRDYNEILKALANQQIEIDLDDGVDVNYAKFEGAVAKI